MSNRVKRYALTAGYIWGGAMFVTTIFSLLSRGYGNVFLNVMASIYPGYSISFIGSIIGAFYGFLDAFLGVYIIAWVYKNLTK